jgi:hypothetical protein
MSDSYITIVPTSVTRGQVEGLSQLTINWLTEKQFISPNKTNCVLGQEAGYSPGPKYRDIVDGDDFRLLSLKTNGLQVVSKRQVFDNGENGLEEINCPKCGANNIDSDWGDVIGAWDSEQDDKLKCNHCDKESSFTDYNFQPTWGFGEFELTFWNWPSLTTAFLDDLKKLLNKDIRVIYGKL